MQENLNTSSSMAWTVSTHRTERGRPLPGCLSTEPVQSIFLNSFSTADHDCRPLLCRTFSDNFSGTVTHFNSKELYNSEIIV